MKDSLGFCFVLSQFTAAIIDAFRSLLVKLPQDVLIYILLFSYAEFLIVQIFRHETKGRAPFNLWFVEIPPWVAPSCFVAALTLLLIL